MSTVRSDRADSSCHSPDHLNSIAVHDGTNQSSALPPYKHYAILRDHAARKWIDRLVFIALVCVNYFVSCMTVGAADSTDLPPDEPLLVATAASFNQLIDRGVTLSEFANQPLPRETIAKWLEDNGNTGGIDFSKPVGVMLFFSMDSLLSSGSNNSESNQKTSSTPESTDVESRKKKSTSETSEKSEDDSNPDESSNHGEIQVGVASEGGLQVIADGIDSGLMELTENFENQRFAMFVAVKDFDDYLSSSNLKRIPGEQYQFEQPNGEDIYLRRIGHYVLIAFTKDIVEYCPDPREVVRPLISRHDVAISFRARGFPIGLRTLTAEALKTGYAATLQRRDGEPEPEYKLRRAIGALVGDVLEMALSHIDEITLGIRVDPNRKTFVAEFEVVGTETDKFSRFVQEWTPKRSAFSHLREGGESKDFALSLSLAIPERHSKAISAAGRAVIQKMDPSTIPLLFPQLYELGFRLIESRQIDVVFQSGGEKDNQTAMLGIKFPRDNKLPESIERIFQLTSELTWKTPNAWTLNSGEINGFAMHHFATSIMTELFGGTSDSSVKTEFQDGGIDLIATHDAVWIASRSKEAPDNPSKLLSLAVETNDAPLPKSSGSISPLRIVVNAANVKASGQTTIDEKDIDPKRRIELLKQIERENRQREVTQALYDEKPHGLFVELASISKGFKLTTTVEEAIIAAMWLNAIELNGLSK